MFPVNLHNSMGTSTLLGVHPHHGLAGFQRRGDAKSHGVAFFQVNPKASKP